ncbi:hypothetical protein DSCW_08430 [Desulfosarcina widdelii]|uniref:Guanylate cyclase domain-containing protein n=1 Tax=Desulfosarcina widdelii TaxID=947919 RepID=A0A5K7YVT0_9BACT|nr:hypothetical protein [Desulfosarcina widdelii]BBO73426.1 hypothetical protein DSCW_08430 [Desulfosarcina widdelii]
MIIQRRWNRQSTKLELKMHIVAFLDILGFKNILQERRYNDINVLFEEIADTIYQYKRRSFLSAWENIFYPKVINFSDSIIIYQPLFEKKGTWSFQINHNIFESFQFIVRDVVATSLLAGIPIRGAINVGEFFAGEALSVVPDKVYRGPRMIPTYFIEDLGDPPPIPEDYENKILDAVRLPMHFGDALTDAYLMEGKINSIGVFLPESALKNPLCNSAIQHRIALRDIIKLDVEGKSMYALNWCNRMDYETYLKLEDYIKNQINVSEGTVKAKWISLYEFTKTAPKK